VDIGADFFRSVFFDAVFCRAGCGLASRSRLEIRIVRLGKSFAPLLRHAPAKALDVRRTRLPHQKYFCAASSELSLTLPHLLPYNR